VEEDEDEVEAVSFLPFYPKLLLFLAWISGKLHEECANCWNADETSWHDPRQIEWKARFEYRGKAWKTKARNAYARFGLIFK
jgi:hypothetical protein